MLKMVARLASHGVPLFQYYKSHLDLSKLPSTSLLAYVHVEFAESSE
jgi:hypothetical protein